MALFEKNYEEREDGRIVQVYSYRGEELATKSDVYEWHMKSRTYTDACRRLCKAAIGISMASVIISAIITCAAI